MSLKNLKTKDQIFENSFNPYLDGSTINGSTFIPPAYNTDNLCMSNMIEKPLWLDSDEEPMIFNGDILSIGTYYMNGLPLSTWSAQHGGGPNPAMHKKQIMQNFYYVNTLAKRLFPDGIGAFLKKQKEITYDVTNLKIMKMIPCSIGIGLNIHVRFKLNDEELWGKFENVGVDLKPSFVCEEIKDVDIENKIRITGKIWNTLLDWFKVKTGIYQMQAKSIFVFTELGQLKQLNEGDAIEVLHSDENRIKIKHKEIIYLIKKPIYYWFNWYFIKIT